VKEDLGLPTRKIGNYSIQSSLLLFSIFDINDLKIRNRDLEEKLSYELTI